MNEYAAEVERINGNVASTYSALSEMGATMPAQQNSDNLPGTVLTVPQGSSTSVQTDWNQTDETKPDFLKNKPFGETITYSDTASWDGVNSEVVVLDMLYLVSKTVLTAEDLANGVLLTMTDGINEMQIPVAPEEVETLPFLDDGAMIAFESGMCIIPYDGYNLEGVEIPVAGLYAFTGAAMYLKSLTIPNFSFENITIEKIQEKFLPNTALNPGAERVMYTSFEDNGEITNVVLQKPFTEILKAYLDGSFLFVSGGLGVFPVSAVDEKEIQFSGIAGSELVTITVTSTDECTFTKTVLATA